MGSDCAKRELKRREKQRAKGAARAAKTEAATAESSTINAPPANKPNTDDLNPNVSYNCCMTRFSLILRRIIAIL
jgi:hypothetical protein